MTVPDEDTEEIQGLGVSESFVLFDRGENFRNPAVSDEVNRFLVLQVRVDASQPLQGNLGPVDLQEFLQNQV